MKIRTDFVTNSSSSSFVAYKLDGEALEEFFQKTGLMPRTGGFCDVEFDEDDMTTIALSMDGEGLSLPTLPQGLVNACTGTQYADSYWEMPEWEEMGEERFGSGQKAAFPDYEFSQHYDGTEESVVKVIHELFSKTDFADRVSQEVVIAEGDGEIGTDAYIGGFRTSGEEICRTDGKLTGYKAHPYNGGFGYNSGAECFIEFADSKLTVQDAESELSDDYNVVWDDETCASATGSLDFKQVQQFRCAEVTEIVLPASCYKINDEAFVECPRLKRLEIHRKNVDIGDEIVRSGVIIAGHLGSTAKAYADEHGLPFELLRTRPMPEERVRYSNALTLTVFGEGIWCPETEYAYASMEDVNLPGVDGEVKDIQIKDISLQAVQEENETNADTLQAIYQSDADGKILVQQLLDSDDAEAIIRATHIECLKMNLFGNTYTTYVDTFDVILLDKVEEKCYQFLVTNASSRKNLRSKIKGVLHLLADVLGKAKLHNRSLCIRDAGLNAMAEKFAALVLDEEYIETEVEDVPEELSPAPDPVPVLPPYTLDGRTLRKGERLDLTGYEQTPMEIQLLYRGMKESMELDVYTFLLYENDKVRGDADLVFFGNEQGVNGAVTLKQTGEHPSVIVRLEAVPTDVQKIAVCFSAYGEDERLNFALVESPAIVLSAGDQQICHLELQGQSVEKTLVAMELYRYKGNWKLKAVGSGYQGKLKTLCESFGLEVVE